MNNEERIAKLVQNDWSTAPVPKEYRRSDYGVVATLVGQIIALSGIYVGASMSGQLTIMEALLATVIGSAVLALIGGLLSWIGTRTGVGLSMLLRESFGCIGSYIIAVLLVLVCIGFFRYPVWLFWRHNPRDVPQRRIYHRHDGCRNLGRHPDGHHCIRGV